MLSASHVKLATVKQARSSALHNHAAVRSAKHRLTLVKPTHHGKPAATSKVLAALSKQATAPRRPPFTK
jgi:hypothetical protein